MPITKKQTKELTPKVKLSIKSLAAGSTEGIEDFNKTEYIKAVKSAKENEKTLKECMEYIVFATKASKEELTDLNISKYTYGYFTNNVVSGWTDYKLKEKEKLDKKAAKVKKAEEDAKKLQDAKEYLTEEGVSFEDKKDDEIIKLSEETAKSPKYPFHIRIYGNNQEGKFKFEDGKRYSLTDVKKTVIEDFFELKKADFEYDKERNTVFISLSSSQKG